MRKSDHALPDSEQYETLLDKALQHNKLASHLAPVIYEQLRHAMKFVWARGGEVVMREGEPSDTLAIVVLGRVRVVRKEADGQQTTLLELGPGQTIGEMGMVTGEVRSADVVANRDSLLATLSREAYNQLLKTYPLEMNQQFVRPIIGRLRAQLHGATRINASVLAMVLLPMTANVPLRTVAQTLYRGLQQAGPALYLDAQVIETHFGHIDDADTEAERRLTRWLGEQEAAHEMVMYVDDGQNLAWTRRCLRQADKIVLVGDTAVSTPRSESHITALQQPEAAALDRYLVLVQPDEVDMPTGTGAWLAALDVRHHYHLRLGKPADVGRVARLLAGRGVGVAMCGASARGFVHVGAVRALREAGIPVDVVGGTSSGSVSAIGLATGWDDAEIVRRAGSGPKLQFTLPFSALTTGKGNAKWMETSFGGLQLEDCWLPHFFPLYNLTRNELTVHERGPAARLLRAATALPGIFPPLVEGDNIIVDAGVVNYIPVDIMRQRPDVGTVIALDAVTFNKNKGRKSYAYDGLISGWTILWNRLNPFAKKLRYVSLADILLRTILIGGTRLDRATRGVADHRIRLMVSHFDMLDFSRIAELVEYGYEQTTVQIKEARLDKKLRPGS